MESVGFNMMTDCGNEWRGLKGTNLRSCLFSPVPSQARTV